MALEGLDLVGVSRSLSQLVGGEDDLVDAYFERLEVLELPPDRSGAGIGVWREEGFAVRLGRGEKSWLATGDSLTGADFMVALRQVARSWPQATYPPPDMRPAPWPEIEPEKQLLRFPSAVNRSLRRRLVAFPLSLRVRQIRRWIQVVGHQLVPGPQSETFFSIEATAPWGRRGLLATRLEEETVERLADLLCESFEARDNEPPAEEELAVAFSSQAAAVFLHEAVAHALEADTLAAGGRVEAAIGVRMGPAGLSVLDDPGSAPESVRRSTDDEGRPVERRWLLRDGVVEQPLADAYWAQRSAALLPGSGRRGGRMDPPTPRSAHLMLLPGEAGEAELLAGSGVWVPQVIRGRLVVETGLCRLRAPFGVRFRDGELAETIGPFTLEGHFADLMDGVEAIGAETVETGAGWCVKGWRRVPVWAMTPAMRLARARVKP